MRKLSLILTLMTVLAGCESDWLSKINSPQAEVEASENNAVAEPAEQGLMPYSTTAARSASENKGLSVMATVNGRPIYMIRLNDLLIRGHGLQIAQQLVACELVSQAARKANVSTTGADIDAESERTLKQMFGDVDNEHQQQRLLDELLERRNVSRELWQLTIQRNALLRKLAEPRINITDEQLSVEYEDRYGRRYHIRHIQVASLEEAQMLLEKLSQGGDFAELAGKHSKNPSAADGGLLPAIGPKSPGLPTAIRQATREMKKIGEISGPIQVGTAFHILKLEKILGPQDVNFADVKNQLTASIRNRQIGIIQQQILRELISSAEIIYANKILKEQSPQAD